MFASSIAEELWSVSPETALRLESRTDRGFAFTSFDGRGFTIIGGDSAGHVPEVFPDLVDEIDDSAAKASETLRSVVDETLRLVRDFRFARPLRLRAFSRVRAVSSGRGSHRDESLLLALTSGSASEAVSVIATPGSLESDLALLRVADMSSMDFDYRIVPLLFVNGSGAVLLHEAIGHPSQSGKDPSAKPEWLEVADDPSFPSLGAITVDDCGLPVQSTVLNGGQSPAAWRRESFRDVPARRMTNLVVRCSTQPVAALPSPRMEILLVGGGHYDSLTDQIVLTISRAALVSDDRRTPVRPFTLVENRETVLKSLRGSRGDLTSYPGVICFEEGHRVPVGSASPDLLLEPLAG